LIWTPTKMAPAAAAQSPAAAVRRFEVMFMSVTVGIGVVRPHHQTM
jgi:hypothetical protein